MTGFSERETLKRRSRASRSRRDLRHVTTIECGHAESRQGIILELVDPVEPTTAQDVERLVAGAMAVAAESGADICSPGAWVVLIGAEALLAGYACAVQRVPDRAESHYALVVGRTRMLEQYPPWPALIAPDGSCIDARGAEVLALGPSTLELEALRESRGFAGSVLDLRKLWDAGVLAYDENRKLVVDVPGVV